MSSYRPTHRLTRVETRTARTTQREILRCGWEGGEMDEVSDKWGPQRGLGQEAGCPSPNKDLTSHILRRHDKNSHRTYTSMMCTIMTPSAPSTAGELCTPPTLKPGARFKVTNTSLPFRKKPTTTLFLMAIFGFQRPVKTMPQQKIRCVPANNNRHILMHKRGIILSRTHTGTRISRAVLRSKQAARDLTQRTSQHALSIDLCIGGMYVCVSLGQSRGEG